MIYVVMTFYLAGVSVLIAGDIKWNNMWLPCDGAAIIGNTVVGFLFLIFIGWQLRNRTIAANIVAACDIVRFQIWTHTPPPFTTTTHDYKKTVKMFCFLWCTAKSIKKRFWRWVVTNIIPFALIVIWHGLLFLRIHSACRKNGFDFLVEFFWPFAPYFLFIR